MTEALKLTKNDKTLIERCIKEAIIYTYAPCERGGTHVKLVRSTTSISLRKRLHALALAGYVSEAVEGTADHEKPPETSIVFKATALGREAVDYHEPIKPQVYSVRSATDTELLEDASKVE